MPAKPRPLLALMNGTPALLGLLQHILAEEGYRTVSTYHNEQSVEEIIEFVRQHNPDLVLYDVSEPWGRNWRKALTLREALPEYPWVTTTVDVDALTAAVGPNDAIPLFGHPFRIEKVIDTIRAAVIDRFPNFE